ncbi:MAG: DNA polymerase I, partial [Lachnospiraceae bacterium]|nr:DNA polymerase I [Lachnospiraceae bacterium]
GKKCFSELPQDAVRYGSQCAKIAALAAPVLADKLAESGMQELFYQIEMPLTYVLYDMERLGIRVRRDELKAYGERLGDRITELEKAIWDAAGEEFNILSPKQLGEILFEKMGLPGGKKTKTGYSTAADVLEKLAGASPIVRDVLEYRGLTKLRSTYAEGLSEFITADNRIHTTFHQTITATGRISSSDPNLQNIPMRTELGRLIRKVFVPRDGWSFADADYSQIELRILAAMSGDEALISAYRENRDIHAMTASRVFHVPFEEVTPLMRRNAKAVNFGIVYGISSFGLSQDLSISRAEAAEYIEQYFATYPQVKTFLDGLVDHAKERGYAETLFRRRRPIPELKSSNFMQRSFGERVAMNAPIQGTAADIMKIAMLRVWKRIRDEKLDSRMILQIHDELLIETAPGEEEKVRQILTEEMMHAADLAVPLEVDCHLGADWYEAK